MTTIQDFEARSLAGKPVALRDYQGKVVLVVNTASKCGFTPQYQGLEELYKKYQDRGLVVLGFPCNQFLSQEPGGSDEIGAFCERNYGVSFPMFEKSVTKAGAQQSPVYKFLTAKQPEPKWNFTKYLVGKDGQVITSFVSKVTPESKELHDAIEAALK